MRSARRNAAARPGSHNAARPGFASYPRYPVFRVNDLVEPHVDTAAVLAALAAAGVPVASREEPVGTSVRAVVTPTAAGTVVTLERRGSLLAPRGAVHRRLVRLWDGLAEQWDTVPRGPFKPA